MTIDEAIKELTELQEDLSGGTPDPAVDAIKLGIEALKRHKDKTRLLPSELLQPLPGETEQ